MEGKFNNETRYNRCSNHYDCCNFWLNHAYAFTTSSVKLDMDKYPVKYNVFVINDGNMKTYSVYNAQKITDNTVEITMPSGSRYTISGDYIEISRLE